MELDIDKLKEELRKEILEEVIGNLSLDTHTESPGYGYRSTTYVQLKYCNEVISDTSID